MASRAVPYTQHPPASPAGSARPRAVRVQDQSPWRLRFAQIHNVLRERITLLTYPPGTRLDLDRLAAEFEVSRTPIRTVLQRLEHEGLVHTRHGVGTAVAEVDFDHIREATLLRMHLAQVIGSLNPRPPDQAALDVIDKLPARIRGLMARQDHEEYVRIDLRLHQCITNQIGNELLLRTYDELFFQTVRMWYSYLPLMHWETEVSSFTDHIELTRGAMHRGDVKAVGLITRNAISSGLFRMDQSLAASAES